jgi:hypothetical protein
VERERRLLPFGEGPDGLWSFSDRSETYLLERLLDYADTSWSRYFATRSNDYRGNTYHSATKPMIVSNMATVILKGH